MIEYFNQSLSWQHVLTRNEYNEPTYTTTIIKGRKQTGFKLIRDSKGQQVVSSALVFTNSLINNGDLIDGKLVIAVNNQVGLDGSTQFLEVSLQ